MKKLLAVCIVLLVAVGAYGQSYDIHVRYELGYTKSCSDGNVSIKGDVSGNLVDSAPGYLLWIMDNTDTLKQFTDTLQWSMIFPEGTHTLTMYVKTTINMPDSVHIFTDTMHIKKNIMAVTIDSICKGELYAYIDTVNHDTIYYIASIDIDSTHSKPTHLGCDSIFGWKLIVNPTYLVFDTVTIFSGESYNGHTTNYIDTLKTIGCGCDSIVSVYLRIIPISNTFTPNGDGINDIFLQGFHVQVFTRNGLLIYDGTNGWDGTYKGKPVKSDTYFYVLYYPLNGTTKTKNGYVVVDR